MEMEASNLNWKQIGASLAGAAIATVLAGLALSWLQAREPHLVYSSPETIPYVGVDKQVAVYQVTLANKGKKSATSIVCYVQIPSAQIEGSRVIADKAMNLTETTAQDVYRVQIPELNPSETVVLSVLASKAGVLPTKPTISLRASGVAGQEDPGLSSARETGWTGSLLSIVNSLIGVMSAFAILAYMAAKRVLSSLEGGKHSEDQREVLAYLCGLYGLNEEVEKLLAMPRSTSYWAEADRLAAKGVSGSSAEEAEKYKEVLKAIPRYAAISSLSEGIVYYDIARLSAKQGSAEEAKRYLQLARPKMKKLLDTRLELDQLLQRYV